MQRGSAVLTEVLLALLVLSNFATSFAQEISCPEDSTLLENDDVNAVLVAEILGSKWYKPDEHKTCGSQPLQTFLDTIVVTKACVSPGVNATSTPDGASQTFNVSFNGTVPCTEEGREALLKEIPDAPFTLEFEAEATYPSPGGGIPSLRGELVGPPNKPINFSISGPIKPDSCPSYSEEGQIDDPVASKIAERAAVAWYKPDEHEKCGSQPTANFLSSIKIKKVCISQDKSRFVSFDATVPCTEDGKQELLNEKPYAFTLDFEASGREDGTTERAEIVGGDGKFAPKFTCPSDDCSFSDASRREANDGNRASFAATALAIIAAIPLAFV